MFYLNSPHFKQWGLKGSATLSGTVWKQNTSRRERQFQCLGLALWLTQFVQFRLFIPSDFIDPQTLGHNYYLGRFQVQGKLETQKHGLNTEGTSSFWSDM